VLKPPGDAAEPVFHILNRWFVGLAHGVLSLP
jgi:hypothetical protein